MAPGPTIAKVNLVLVLLMDNPIWYMLTQLTPMDYTFSDLEDRQLLGSYGQRGP